MARGRRRAGWELHRRPDGTYDVTLDGRSVLLGCEDQDDAAQVVRSDRRYRRGDPIAHVELDGYRTVVAR